jgi:hypothetical protein
MGYQRISNQGLCNPAVRDLSFIHRDVSRVGGFVLTRQEAARKWGRRPTPWSARRRRHRAPGLGGIGAIGARPHAPYGPYAPWPWRTHKVASPVPRIFTEAKAACRRRTDQSLAPSLAADEEVPCLFGGSHHCSPAAVNVCARPQRAPSLRTCTQEEGGHSDRRNRLDPSDGCCRRKEHRKKVRVIRPRQSEAEQGEQRNYGELPYVGVQSVPSLCRGLRLALS